MISYKLKTAPTTEPVTLAEAKLHLKVDSDTTDDNLITALITAAREIVENYTGRALINQTWEACFEEFPDEEDADDNYVPLRPGPLSSISSVVYLDTAGVSTTASASTLYEADAYSMPGRLCLRYGQVWPSTRDVQNAVTVTFVAGYGSAAASVPGAIKAAILLIIGHLYEHRESVVIGANPTELPQGALSILNPYRIIEA